MTILGEKLAEIEAALEISQTALIELHKENEELQEECKSLHGQLQDCGRRYEHTKTDRDEWKRRALEAEEVLEKILKEVVHTESSRWYRLHFELLEEAQSLILRNSINSGIPATDIEAE